MLLAPLFNKAIEYMSKREFQYVLLALVLINSYFGFFCKQDINWDGNTLMQLTYVYFIGRYLALYLKADKLKLRKWTAVIAVCSIAMYALVWLLNDNYLHLVKTYTFLLRNNLWSVCNSIVIFLFFTALKIESKSINWLAKGAFAIYLVHDSVWIGMNWNTYLMNIYEAYSPVMAWGMVTAVFIVYLFSVLCFDHIRAFMTDPIARKIDQWCTKLIQKF